MLTSLHAIDFDNVVKNVTLEKPMEMRCITYITCEKFISTFQQHVETMNILGLLEFRVFTNL